MSAQVFSSPNGPPHRIAMLSLHSSPLAELGGEIAGGMNVFLREVTRELHKLGVELDIFTRRDDPDRALDYRPLQRNPPHSTVGGSADLSIEGSAFQLHSGNDRIAE